MSGAGAGGADTGTDCRRRTDLRGRVQRVALYFRDFPRRNASAFRQVFARTMDTWPGGQGAQTRGGRRIPAFAPIRDQIDPTRHHQLLMALSSSATGFEQHVAMTDGCGQTAPEADAIGVQVMDALLAHALP